MYYRNMLGGKLMNGFRINLDPVQMTEEIMIELEKRNIIYRLCPGHDILEVEEGATKWKEIYSTDERFGTHKLITVTTNRYLFEDFGYHSDVEDFWLIGHEGTKKLLLSIALCDKDKLLRKIKNKTLCKDDFITLICKFNDPRVSFFSMNKYIPHVETVEISNNKPASFYVTEPTNLDLHLIDFQEYKMNIIQII